MCTDNLQAALEAIQESEQNFVEMLNSNNPYPEPLTFGGLAMVRYNAAVLFRMPGDIDGNFAKSNAFRLLAGEALDEADDLDKDRDPQRDFVRSALAALPSLA